MRPEELERIVPSRERLEKGSAVIIECFQQIPCNPCAEACKFGALKKNSLVDPPEIDYEKCYGCGECVALCPGLAIFVVNLKYKRDEALLMIPYERLPVLKRGEIYEALDRTGTPVAEARIVAVRECKDRTKVVSIAVNRKDAMIVRELGKKIR